jgi:hypothetical protein
MLFRWSVIAFSVGLSLNAAPRQSVSVVTTQSVKFAEGGTIRIAGSVGELNVEGWDRPEVQIEVTRTLFRDETPSGLERVKKDLEGIRLQAGQSSPNELVLSTVFPKHRFPVSLVAKCEVNLDYRIMVPRNSKLAIAHGRGDITIYDVSGDIQAHLRAGDIVVQLPQPGVYNIDARTSLGTVYTDFDGARRAPFLMGQRFAGTATGPARQITLRSSVGGISILKMTAPIAAPVSTP